ncbi:MAG TPA: hypothetical protein VJ972_06310, partial [Anaerolineales bacterium]|nr:hypothetical protein [Anaerolineales bacterium]
ERLNGEERAESPFFAKSFENRVDEVEGHTVKHKTLIILIARTYNNLVFRIPPFKDSYFKGGLISRIKTSQINDPAC